MSDTSFVSRVTSILASWLNQVNALLFYGRRPGYGTTTGSANAQVLTLETGSLYTTSVDGDTFTFIAGFSNTGATTLQIKPPGGSNTARAVEIGGQAVTIGNILAGDICTVVRKGTTWQLTVAGKTVFGASLEQAANATAARTLLDVPSRAETVNIVNAAGDIITATADNTPAILSVGATGSYLAVDPLLPKKIAWIVPPQYISGLRQQPSGVSNVRVTVFEGEAVDYTDFTSSVIIKLPLGMNKDVNASWVVGDSVGGLDAGSVPPSTWYYLFLILRPDTGVVDLIFSTSSISPTLPANYTYYRLIGAVFTTATSVIEPFSTILMGGGGLEYKWNTPSLDVNLSNTLTTSRRTDRYKTPTIRSLAKIRVRLLDSTTAGVAIICCPDEADAAAGGGTAPLGNISWLTTASAWSDMQVWTDVNGLIAARASLATVDTYSGVTLGFYIPRTNTST